MRQVIIWQFAMFQQRVDGSREGSGIRFFDFTLELAAHPASRMENRRIEGLTPIAFILTALEFSRKDPLSSLARRPQLRGHEIGLFCLHLTGGGVPGIATAVARYSDILISLWITELGRLNHTKSHSLSIREIWSAK